VKIVSWNCNGAYRKKAQLLEPLGLDILVLQECGKQEIEDIYQNQQFYWKGEKRGLAVICNKNQKLEPLNWDSEDLKHFLPVRVNDSINLIAVWTKQDQGDKFSYIGQLWKYLNKHKQEIANQPTILCGDFNSNSCWDKPKREWNHSEVVKILDEIGIKSLYHEITGENQGKESEATLYMYRDKLKPYHIDYIFVPKEMITRDAKIEIGKPEEWLLHSDHMPIFASF